MFVNFSYRYFFSYLYGSLTCRKIGVDVFMSPPKEVTQHIFMALENPPSSAGFEPANLGSNGKHDNHYTTENDMQVLTVSHAT
jgi:hypothetical protein